MIRPSASFWHALARCEPLVRRLPMWPAAAVLARALTERWWPLVAPDVRRELVGGTVEVVVTDLGVRVRLHATARGIEAAGGAGGYTVRIQAQARHFLAMMQGDEDPDTLFFDRRLVMEGDTAYGLLLKNTLDALGPVDWRPWRAPARASGLP
ncbi:ubiquinone anaerobic biosynthesis accessory factor UbiT [Aquabacterium fontiphilum]|uniref:ubiquinone anaerobic biosynthesis accessory factor UbiT n=1 Tax=Aquabacterium fontiphilum TaxID=450365 RepID=UPI00191C01FD